MFHNNGEKYEKISNGAPIYIKIDDVDCGSFKLDSKSIIVAAVGPRGSYRDFSHEFPATQRKPQQAWGFKYVNAGNASFVIALYKKRKWVADDLIGEIELKVGDFELNKVVQKEYILKTFVDMKILPRIKVSVHVDDLGAPAFKPQKVVPAPQPKLLPTATVAH